MTAWDHFPDHELASPDIGEHAMNPVFMEKLVTLRKAFGKPMVLTSAYRTPEHNKLVGGALNGAHVMGRAVDVLMAGEDAYALVKMALEHGFTGIGLKQKGDWGDRFVHLDDMRGERRPRIWTY